MQSIDSFSNISAVMHENTYSCHCFSLPCDFDYADVVLHPAHTLFTGSEPVGKRMPNCKSPNSAMQISESCIRFPSWQW